jgi:hypothetical protein
MKLLVHKLVLFDEKSYRSYLRHCCHEIARGFLIKAIPKVLAFQ